MPQQQAVQVTPGSLELSLKEAIEARCDLRVRARKNPGSVSQGALEGADFLVSERAEALLRRRLNGETDGFVAALRSRDPGTYDKTLELLGDPDRVGFPRETLELIGHSFARPTGLDMEAVLACAWATASPPEARHEIFGGGR